MVRALGLTLLLLGGAAPAPQPPPTPSRTALARSLAYPGASTFQPRAAVSPGERRHLAALGAPLPRAREGDLAFSTPDGFAKVLAYYRALAPARSLELLVDEPIQDGRGRLFIFLSARPAWTATVHVYPGYTPGSLLFLGPEPPSHRRLIRVEVR